MPEFFTAIAPLLTDSFLQRVSLWSLSNIPGFPPVIQTVHILGIAVVMASAMLLNLRILGLAVPSQSIDGLIRRVTPWFWYALLSNLVSGAVFVFARPDRYFNNPVFAAKLAVLLLAVLLFAFFHHQYRQQENPGQQVSARILGKALAAIAIVLWLAVCTGGRWIAYLEYLQYPLWSIEPWFDGVERGFWAGVEHWGISQIIAATNWFPTLETIHVIAAASVVGSLLWVDLRLLGLAATAYPISTLNRELVGWTWGAFAVASITGLGMFITRASGHLDNPAFQSKLLLLLLAGLNMAHFHFRVYRHVDDWDSTAAIPVPVKLAGLLSLCLWSGVMLAGRWDILFERLRRLADSNR